MMLVIATRRKRSALRDGVFVHHAAPRLPEAVAAFLVDPVEEGSRGRPRSWRRRRWRPPWPSRCWAAWSSPWPSARTVGEILKCRLNQQPLNSIRGANAYISHYKSHKQCVWSQHSEEHFYVFPINLTSTGFRTRIFYSSRPQGNGIFRRGRRCWIV
jgi:hypothetical protein